MVGESLSRSILRSPIIVMLVLGCLSSISQIAIWRLLMKVSLGVLGLRYTIMLVCVGLFFCLFSCIWSMIDDAGGMVMSWMNEMCMLFLQYTVMSFLCAGGE